MSVKNVRIHRVSAAVDIGEAGTAIDIATSTDASQVAIPDRKAALILDTGRAYAQWGKYEKAFVALRAAEEIAPQELRFRPAIRRLIHETVAHAPWSMRREVVELANRCGIMA